MRIFKLIFITTCMAFVSTTSAADKLYDSVTFTGYGALQAGELIRGYYDAIHSQVGNSHNLVDHQWIESARSRFGGTFYKGPSLKVNIGFEFNYDFVTIYNPGPNPDTKTSLIPQTYYPDLLIHRADMEYGFLSTKELSLKLQFGYFPFKYNPQATNLGEYLFRSGAYPNFIVNEFYFAETRLLGANLAGTTNGSFVNLPYTVRGNLILTSETTYPTQDFSLAGLVNAELFNDAVEVGGGVQFQRLIPVNPGRTTPHNPDNATFDTVSKDTTYYSFAGTKLMTRICFNIKKFVPMNIFGNEDLKIYGECAVLGVKDYDTCYNNIWERMPVMFGFNIPAFKLLDVLSLEAEYYTNPYFNNNQNQLYSAADNYMPAIPWPNGDQETDPNNYGHGLTNKVDHHWKWSVFAKKSLCSNIQIVAQAARDHSRFQDPMYRQPYYTYNGDVTIAKSDWYFQMRVMWCF